MFDTILYNGFLFIVSAGIIALTVFERLSAPAAPTFLVFASIFAVFGVAVSISNIRHEIKLNRRAR